MEVIVAKKCSKCRQVKLLEDFNVRLKSPDGRRTECKDCSRAYDKTRRPVQVTTISTFSDRQIAELCSKADGWRYPVEPAQLRWGIAA